MGGVVVVLGRRSGCGLWEGGEGDCQLGYFFNK